MLLVRASMKACKTDSIALIAPAVCSAISLKYSAGQGDGYVAPDNLSEVPLAIGSNGCKISGIVCIVVFVVKYFGIVFLEEAIGEDRGSITTA